MILQVEKFQESCKSILGAVDTDSALKSVAYGYDALELEAHDKVLHLNVTNGEYFVSVSLPLEEEASIRAVVDAKLFLALVSKITTKDVELTTTETALVVKANGTYQFPLKYDVDSMVVLPEIKVKNPTSEFVTPSATLMSILNFNSRNVDPNSNSKVQKLYYLDREGCITFTNSTACVNTFSLSDTSIKVELTPKLVKLFKLFKDDDVNVTMGFEEVNGIAQARISLKQENVTITAILPNDASLVNSVPVTAIRTRANKTFNYNVSFDKKEITEAIDRLLLFDTTNTLNRGIGIFEFNDTSVTIFDNKRNNSEVIAYASGTCAERYSANLDLEVFKSILSTTDVQVFNLKFGDNQSVVISFGNIKNVVGQRVIR